MGEQENTSGFPKGSQPNDGEKTLSAFVFPPNAWKSDTCLEFDTRSAAAVERSRDGVTGQKLPSWQPPVGEKMRPLATAHTNRKRGRTMSERLATAGAAKAAVLLVTVLAMVAAMLSVSPSTATASGEVEPDFSGINSADLAGDFDISAASAAAPGVAASQFSGLQAADGSLLVEVLTTDTEGVAAQVEALGGSVEGISEGLAVHAKVNQLILADINNIDGVLGVIPSLSTNANKGQVKGEQIAKIGATRWHQAGTTGKGVKIVIIDAFGGTTWTKSQRSKDVPKPKKTFCRDGGQACKIWTVNGATAQHGVGVAEIIHELAPSAELYLATARRTNDVIAATNWAIAQGADIISMSQGGIAFRSPGDGRGVENAIAAKAAANGVAFFAAAGNSGGNEAQQRDGIYYRGVFTDTDGNGFHEFAPGDESLGFFSCSAGVISTRWNDFTTTSNKFQFSATNATDYDIAVVNLNNQLVSTGEDPQGANGQLPLEYAQGSNCNTGEPGFLFLQRSAVGNGSNGDIIEIMVGNGVLEYWQDAYSAAVPIVDSKIPGVMGVGAIDPARGKAIAAYSSQGPTNDGRITPRISGASCVQTVAYGNTCFNGTSAATPAVAGYAALVLSARLATTPAQLEAFLTRYAVDRGTKGPDSTFGYGEAIAPSAPCGGRLATIMGTNKADKLKGTNRSDVIVGFNGNDRIEGLGGNDILCGNGGKDTLIGGKGNRDICFSNAFGLSKDKGTMKSCKLKR